MLKVLHVAGGTGLNRTLNLRTVIWISVGAGLLMWFLFLPLTIGCPPTWASGGYYCSVHPQRTALLNNAKQLGVSANLYAADFNDTFPVWSSALGRTEVLDSEQLYSGAMQPYMRNKIVWGHPVAEMQMDGLKHGFAYNFWGLGGIFQCANPTFAATSPLCTDRTEARFAEFADEKYNRPARTSEIADISNTVLYTEGSVLARPPQFGIAFPKADAKYIGVWSLTKAGEGPLSGPAGVSDAKGALARFLSGTRTTMVSTDSSAKSKRTSELYGTSYSTPEWRGTLTNNAGWSRDAGGSAPDPR